LEVRKDYPVPGLWDRGWRLAADLYFRVNQLEDGLAALDMIPKRSERNTLRYFRASAGKAWFHTPRLCRGTGSRLSDSGSRALPWGMIPFIYGLENPVDLESAAFKKASVLTESARETADIERAVDAWDLLITTWPESDLIDVYRESLARSS